MTYRITEVNVKTGVKTVIEYTDQEAIDLGLMKSPEQQIADLEAEVQETADALTAGKERDKALALATVDLAMAAADGQLTGMTRANVRQVFRDRIVHYLRLDAGLTTGGA